MFCMFRDLFGTSEKELTLSLAERYDTKDAGASDGVQL